MRKDHYPTTTCVYAVRRESPRRWVGMLAGPVTLAATLLALLLAAPSTASPAERPNLSGVWEMDVELSEDPRQKLEEMRESRRSAMGGRGGMSGGMGRDGMGRGGMGGGRGDMQARMEDMRARMEALMTRLQETKEDARHMEIDHADPDLYIAYADGGERTFKTDGKKTEIETEYGPAEVKADWKRGGRLVVRTEEEGLELTETYELTVDGQLLTVAMEVKTNTRMPPLTFTWLYRPAPVDSQNGAL